MSEVLAIFEKINQVFKSIEKGEEYKMYFSPYSLGYTNEDFLFLKVSSGSTDGAKAADYYDEAFDFANIANNIPRSDNGIWKTSTESTDILYNNYKSLIDALSIVIPTIEDIKYMYHHPIFREALEISGKTRERESYSTYLKLFTDTQEEIDKLNAQPISEKTNIQIELLNTQLTEIEKKWNDSGFKNNIETEIISIFKKEYDKFILERNEAIFTLTNPSNTVSQFPFFFTSCIPNNLYDSDKLSWRSISLQKTQIDELVKNANPGYKALMEGSGLEQLELEEITFELLFANIVRPWFNEGLLLSPFWDIKILNRDSIAIPRYPTELVFVRNINMKLKTGSLKNEEILKIQEKENTQSEGPFHINISKKENFINLFQKKNSKNLENKIKIHASNIGKINALNPGLRYASLLKNKKFQLTFKAPGNILVNPVNAIIKIDGKPVKCPKTITNNVLEVILPENEKYEVELNDDNYENTSFPFSYDKTEEKQLIIKREFELIRKKLNRRLFDHVGNFTKYEITFELEDSHEILDPTSAVICLNGIIQTVYRNITAKILTVAIKGDTKYTIELISNGEYLDEPFDLVLAPSEKNLPIVKRKFTVKKKPEIINESELVNGEFQLLGIICKELPHIPNPII